MPRDAIQLPPPGAFTGSPISTATGSYYSTLFYELTHWTAPAHRCARDFIGAFGSAAYAMEELVAELGAAFLCADLGVTGAPRPDHAQYLADWLRVLRHDKRAIFTAASQASRAATFVQAGRTSAQAGNRGPCTYVISFIFAPPRFRKRELAVPKSPVVPACRAVRTGTGRSGGDPERTPETSAIEPTYRDA